MRTNQLCRGCVNKKEPRSAISVDVAAGQLHFQAAVARGKLPRRRKGGSFGFQRKLATEAHVSHHLVAPKRECVAVAPTYAKQLLRARPQNYGGRISTYRCSSPNDNVLLPLGVPVRVVRNHLEIKNLAFARDNRVRARRRLEDSRIFWKFDPVSNGQPPLTVLLVTELQGHILHRSLDSSATCAVADLPNISQ